MNKRYTIATYIIVALLLGVGLYFTLSGTLCSSCFVSEDKTEAEAVPETIFGIEYNKFALDSGVVVSGETLSTILARYGVGAATTDKISKVSEPVFSLRNIRADHGYVAFMSGSDSTRRLEHLVYEQNITDYVIFTIYSKDSVSVRRESKEITTVREKRSGKITSSLWNAMTEGEMPPSMAMELSDIYAWSIDFFGLQEGDHFTVIYDNQYVDSTNIGAGRIWGAIFNHNGKDYYAIPYKKNDKVLYWDQDGNSLRKNLLKAPLKFSRITSRFSNSRLHPIYKIRRPHHGVDYAAPVGTPVYAVADGVVAQKGYSGGAGNMLKVKHSRDLMSGYLHLRSFAKGIANGTRVNQGDLLGYVGSTGASTGPHLDFRLWRGGKAIDPLKVPSEPTEPIAKENRESFDIVKASIIAELQGEIADSVKITQLETPPFTTKTVIAENVDRR